jgi:hypothetical protein
MPGVRNVGVNLKANIKHLKTSVVETVKKVTAWQNGHKPRSGAKYL